MSSSKKSSLSSLSSSINSIEKLDGTNFHSWKFQITQILKYRGLWKLVNGIEIAPADDQKDQLDQYGKKEMMKQWH